MKATEKREREDGPVLPPAGENLSHPNLLQSFYFERVTKISVGTDFLEVWKH